MKSKKNLFLLLVALSMNVLYSANLVKIINNSPAVCNVVSAAKEFLIQSGTAKNIFLEIPFTPRQKNFIDFIHDLPYVPTDTLKIVTVQGTFYIWCDERGIIIAKAFERGMTRKEALPEVFLSLSQEDQNRVIACILTINNTGFLAIKK